MIHSDDAGALAPAQAGVRSFGRADPVRQSRITGWFVAARARSVITAFIDGQAAGRAAVSDSAIASAPDGARGFVFPIPARWQDGRSHVLVLALDDGTPIDFLSGSGTTMQHLRFRFAAPDQRMPGAANATEGVARDVSALPIEGDSVSAVEGAVDGLVGDTLSGWAVRRNRASGSIDGRLSVQVLCNGVTVGDVVADQQRPDVARELRCDPHVGFQMRLPDECRNGQEFAFSFKVLPEGSELSGSPVAVRYQQMDAERELRALAATLDELCASAFRMQQQLRNLLPAPDATVANYDPWARRYQVQLRSRIAAAESLPDQVPLVSVVMATSRPKLAHLTAAIESVRQQTYGNWELIIADDGSFSPALAACVRNYAAEDSRITCILSRKNRGVALATNAALRKAKGDIVAFFGHDDLMAEVALEAMVREALRTSAKLLYSDEDTIDEFGVFGEPNLKPDWNYRLLLAANYIGSLVLVEHHLLRRAGFLHPDYDGAQDHDLLLRLSEQCLPGEILHVAEILYHGRRSGGSAAHSRDAEPRVLEAGRRAITDHLARRGFAECQVHAIDRTSVYSVSWGLRAQPSVSVIVPFRDEAAMTRRCLDALLAHTRWKDWKVVLVDNGSGTEQAAGFCRDAAANPRVVVQRIDEPFNFARLNNLASRAHPADFYLFLNNDVIITQHDWLRIMVNEALADPAVAIVGAKLVYPNATVQHAGVVLGVGGVAEHAFKGLAADTPGYMSRARCAQQYSAVTAACMLCRAEAFLDVGGFDEHELAVAFNDVDLCLKVARRGGRVIWTPAVMAEHHESLSRGDDLMPGKAARFFRENYVMFQRWHEVLGADPFYSPHFSRERGVFSDLR